MCCIQLSCQLAVGVVELLQLPLCGLMGLFVLLGLNTAHGQQQTHVPLQHQCARTAAMHAGAGQHVLMWHGRVSMHVGWANGGQVTCATARSLLFDSLRKSSRSAPTSLVKARTRASDSLSASLMLRLPGEGVMVIDPC